jgi:hypothetical protein
MFFASFRSGLFRADPFLPTAPKEALRLVPIRAPIGCLGRSACSSVSDGKAAVSKYPASGARLPTSSTVSVVFGYYRQAVGLGNGIERFVEGGIVEAFELHRRAEQPVLSLGAVNTVDRGVICADKTIQDLTPIDWSEKASISHTRRLERLPLRLIKHARPPESISKMSKADALPRKKPL